MPVHVDEVHTDVVPAVLPTTERNRDQKSDRLEAADDKWREMYRAAVMAGRRTYAEGFSD